MLTRNKTVLLFLFILTFSSGCDHLDSMLQQVGLKEKPLSFASIEFGKTEHYESFLWKDGNTPVVNATLVLDFNQVALDENGTVTFKLQDEHGKTVTPSTHKTKLIINGVEYPSGTYTLTADQLTNNNEVDFSLQFEDGAHEGHKGFISVTHSNLDRINDTQLTSGKSAVDQKILHWQAEYESVINPLKKWVLITASIIVLLLLLRLTVFKRKLYPVFNGTVRYFESPTQSRSINFNGHRQVIITNRTPKQGTFDKIWRGKILYINDPLFTAPVEFTPRKRGAIKYKLDVTKYAVTPSDGFIQRGIEYKIKSTDTKQTVTLK
jgi:hypothetical protein